MTSDEILVDRASQASVYKVDFPGPRSRRDALKWAAERAFDRAVSALLARLTSWV